MSVMPIRNTNTYREYPSTRPSSAWLHGHAHLKDNVSVVRRILSLVPERFQVQLNGFLQVPQGLLYRFVLGVATGQRYGANANRIGRVLGCVMSRGAILCS